jgi:hypothetical protein
MRGLADAVLSGLALFLFAVGIITRESGNENQS